MSILAVGFFGEGNLGDEAILEGLAASLPAGCPLTVPAGSRPLGVPAARLPRRGLTAWPAFLRALREAPQVVFTGGMLQDWSFDGVVFYALRMLASSLAGRRPGLWGVGLGPLRHPAARGLAARLLRHAGPVWVRNEGSARLFRELTGQTAHLGCDWSWAIPDPPPDEDFPAREPDGHPALPAKADGRPTDRRIGLNLRPWVDGRFLGQAHQDLGALPPGNLLGVAARAEDARLLRASFPGLEVREPASFTDLMRVGRQLSAGWAMRFHVVLAWLRAGLPVVPLAYDDKVDDLSREVRTAGPGQPPSPSVMTLGTAAPGTVQATVTWAAKAGWHLRSMQAALGEIIQAG